MAVDIEYEIKFRATPAVLEKLIAAYGADATVYRMETTYYDTPSGALSARHYTLRRRMENEKSVCTLKTPTGGLGRKELETESDSIENAIDTLCQMGAPADFLPAVREGLVAVCGAKFTRLAVPIVYGTARLELALDRGILTGGQREVPLYEVEVELKSGEQEAVELFAMELSTKYPLQQETASKFRRALALYRGEML